MSYTNQRTMQNGTRFATARPGAERRRERRYEVDLPGEITAGLTTWAVRVSDLSSSGALISDCRDAGLVSAMQITLTLAEFGSIDAVVAHAGADFYGLQFLHPHLFRDRLAAWLRREGPRT